MSTDRQNTNRQNTIILLQLLTQYAMKTQEIGALFRNAIARGGDGDITQEEVDASSLSRDVALMKTQSTIDGSAR